MGRLSTRTYPDGGVEKFGYSARGLTAHTNQLNQATYYAYDEARRKTFETNANSEVIRYTNNAAGDLIALVDGKNQVTKWNYDEYGRVTNKLDQAGTEILRYQYDPNSRLTNRDRVTPVTGSVPGIVHCAFNSTFLSPRWTAFFTVTWNQNRKAETRILGNG